MCRCKGEAPRTTGGGAYITEHLNRTVPGCGVLHPPKTVMGIVFRHLHVHDCGRCRIAWRVGVVLKGRPQSQQSSLISAGVGGGISCIRRVTGCDTFICGSYNGMTCAVDSRVAKGEVWCSNLDTCQGPITSVVLGDEPGLH